MGANLVKKAVTNEGFGKINAGRPKTAHYLQHTRVMVDNAEQMVFSIDDKQ